MSAGSVAKLGVAFVALIAAAVMLGGCMAPGAPQSADASKAPAPASEATQTPEPQAPPQPLPPPNNLDATQIGELTALCPDVLSDAALRVLPQYGVDAVNFFATTGQCGDAGTVLAAGEYPRPFESPLQYVDAPCPAGTLLTVWAHYDDDLIFGSPSIPRALDAQKCVRTLYLTASDAGRGDGYGLERERGLRAAYDAMRGASTPWEDRAVLLSNGITLAMSRPTGDPRITLFFLRLPDGGLDANGFSATGGGSIPQLLNGLIPDLPRLGGAAPVNAQDLPATVSQLYAAYAPEMVMTTLPGVAQGSHGDHPDHAAVGNIIAGMADRGLVDTSTLTYAQGYPITAFEPNLGGDELTRKLDVFVKYAVHDVALRCTTVETCLKLRLTGPWLLRQYVIPHAEIVRAGS